MSESLPFSLDCLISILDEAFSPYLVYLFGSMASGRHRTDSDIDIAFLSDQQPLSWSVFGVAQKAATQLGRDVDLIDLASATTVLRAQIVHRGIRVVNRDPIRVRTFEMRVLKDYAILNEDRAVVINRLSQGGFYGR